jgi:hypothetical protein
MLCRVIEVGRRLAVGACILLLGLVVVIGLGAGSGGPSGPAACASRCGSGAPATAAAPSSHPSIPCLRDAACSGGVLLGAGGGAALALVVPAALGVLALALTRIRRGGVRRLARGRLVDGGRFHPPQVLLGI